MDDPNVIVSIAIFAVGIIVTGITAYHSARRGTEVALAVLQERQTSMQKEIDYNEEWRHLTATPTLNDHETRISVLESRG